MELQNKPETKNNGEQRVTLECIKAPDNYNIEYVQGTSTMTHIDPLFFMDGKVNAIPNPNTTATNLYGLMWSEYSQCSSLYGTLDERNSGSFINAFRMYYDWEMAGNITLLLINCLWDSVYRIFTVHDILSDNESGEELKARLFNICKEVLDYKEIEDHFIGIISFGNIQEAADTMIKYKVSSKSKLDDLIGYSFISKDKMVIHAVSYYAHYANILANHFANEIMHGPIHPTEGINPHSVALKAVAGYINVKEIDRNLIHAVLNTIFANYSHAFAGVIDHEMSRLTLGFLSRYPEHVANVATIVNKENTKSVNLLTENNHF